MTCLHYSVIGGGLDLSRGLFSLRLHLFLSEKQKEPSASKGSSDPQIWGCFGNFCLYFVLGAKDSNLY